MKPTIAITCAYDEITNRAMLHMKYVELVFENGGVPIMIHLNSPNYTLPKVDGIIFSGGGDINSVFFNQKLHPKVTSTQYERDLFEFSLINQCKNLPILGICRGMQLINIAYGGNIYQHIEGHMLEKKTCHNVQIMENSKLYEITKTNSLLVNSLHHQAIHKIAPDFNLCAIDDYGIIEAIEHKTKPILGVQWHPEKLQTDSNIFKHFVNICTKKCDFDT